MSDEVLVEIQEVVEVLESEVTVIETVNESTDVLETEATALVEVINDTMDVLEVIDSEPPTIYIPENELRYEKEADFVGELLIYRGEAAPGASRGAAVWRIWAITFAEADGDISESWADGTDAFNKVWVDRLTYTYANIP